MIEFTSVIMPVYNDRPHLSQAIVSLTRGLQREFGGGYELIVVDDASGDGTPRVLRQLGAIIPRLVIQEHVKSAGLRACIRSGLFVARSNRLMIFESCCHDVAEGLICDRKRALAMLESSSTRYRNESSVTVTRGETWIRLRSKSPHASRV